MKHRQTGLFAVKVRAAQLTKMGDSLLGLNARIDWNGMGFILNLNVCMTRIEKIRRVLNRLMCW
ncbi:MAG: hypothetical protein WCH01_05040 [Methylococcaceae bacterium]